MSTLILGALVALLAPPAATKDAPATQPAKPKAADLMGDQAVIKRGAAFTVEKAVTLDEVAKAPETFAGKVVKVSAKIEAVCKKKGCWVTLAGTSPSTRCRVSFKDYAFFVPKDAANAMATVEGTVEVKKLTKAMREHLAGDAGKKVEEIPEVELRIMASAIEIRRVGH